MKLLMEVACFFNNLLYHEGKTVLGGIVLDNVKVGEEVEVVTPTQRCKTKILGIKHFAADLPEAEAGMNVGLWFEGISNLDFRKKHPPNPYDPKTQLMEFLEFRSKDNNADEIRIYRNEGERL